MNSTDFESIKQWYITRLNRDVEIKNKKIDIGSEINRTFYLYENNFMPSFFKDIDSELFDFQVNKLVDIHIPEKDRKITTQNIINFKNQFIIFFGSYSEYLEAKLKETRAALNKERNLNNIETVQEFNSEYSPIIIATYEGAKKFYNNDFSTKQECFEYITSFDEEFKIEEIQSSAQIYLSMFKRLMLGERISGNFSLKYGRYFIERIYLDYGIEQLNLALKALSLHIQQVSEKKILLGKEIAQKFGGSFNL